MRNASGHQCKVKMSGGRALGGDLTVFVDTGVGHLNDLVTGA